jgi:hypothetical protein
MTNTHTLPNGGADKALPVNTEAQRRRLLAALVQRPITTIQARNELNILMPAARIIELRKLGHDIYTERVNLHDHEGREHPRCARYHLISLAAQLEDGQ